MGLCTNNLIFRFGEYGAEEFWEAVKGLSGTAILCPEILAEDLSYVSSNWEIIEGKFILTVLG